MTLTVLDTLLAPDYAQRLLDHWERHPGFGLSGDGGTPLGRHRACAVAHRPRPAADPPPLPVPRPALFDALGQRADATANYVRTGGISGDRAADPATLRARTNYFRATYASGVRIWEPVVCPLLGDPALAEAAGTLFDRPVVVPTEVYANVMLPGQELGIHTDVPAFRGASRGRYPLWLLVVMQHSGQFDAWRVRHATAVLHLGAARHPGGEFVYYPDGPDGAAVARQVRHNCALVLDTDTVLHGVGRVGGPDASGLLASGMTLRCGTGRWQLCSAGTARGGWGSDELRYSISWKAQCFADEAERRETLEHSDDLDHPAIMRRLLAGLPAGAADLPPPRLGRLLIDTYLRFPSARPHS